MHWLPRPSQVQAEGLLSCSKAPASTPAARPALPEPLLGAQSEFQGCTSWAVPVGWGGPRRCF